MEWPLPDVSTRRALNAAEGWLELGNVHEAWEETESIHYKEINHPSVLYTRWRILMQAKRYEDSLHLGSALTKIAPKTLQSWLCHARSLHRTGRTEEASQMLSREVENHPARWKVFYDLACFSAGLGRKTEAAAFLETVYALCKDPQAIRRKVVSDPDLEPLFEERS